MVSFVNVTYIRNSTLKESCEVSNLCFPFTAKMGPRHMCRGKSTGTKNCLVLSYLLVPLLGSKTRNTRNKHDGETSRRDFHGELADGGDKQHSWPLIFIFILQVFPIPIHVILAVFIQGDNMHFNTVLLGSTTAEN